MSTHSLRRTAWNQRRRVLALLCQALWSLRTFAFSLIGAHLLTTSSYGQLSAALIVHFGAMRLWRSAILDSTLSASLRSGSLPQDGLPALSAVLNIVPAVAGVALFRLDGLGAVAVVLTGLPLSASVEAFRLELLSRGRFVEAVFREATWTGFAAILITATASMNGAPTSTWLMAAWCFSAFGYGFVPRISRRLLAAALESLAAVRDNVRRQSLEVVTDLLFSYGSLGLVGVWLGFEALGAIQAAQNAAGPASFLFTTTAPLAVIWFAGQHARKQYTSGIANVIALASVTAAVAWSTLLYYSSPIRTALLGEEVGVAARSVMIPMGIFVGVTGAQAILNARLRGIGASKQAALYRLRSSLLLPVAPVVALSTGSTMATAWSLAGAGVVGLFFWLPRQHDDAGA